MAGSGRGSQAVAAAMASQHTADMAEAHAHHLPRRNVRTHCRYALTTRPLSSTTKRTRSAHHRACCRRPALPLLPQETPAGGSRPALSRTGGRSSPSYRTVPALPGPRLVPRPRVLGHSLARAQFRLVVTLVHVHSHAPLTVMFKIASTETLFPDPQWQRSLHNTILTERAGPASPADSGSTLPAEYDRPPLG